MPELKNPYLIAAWPGMGDVAIKAAEYLKIKLSPVKFAEIEGKDFFPPNDILIVKDEIKAPLFSVGEFFHYKNIKGKNDLIIFTCTAQPELSKGYEYANLVVNTAKRFKIKRIFTFAAMPTAMNHMQKPNVWGTATHKHLILDLQMQKVKLLDTGQISGLNGLLLGVAKELGIEGICLLGELPFYTIQLENPKSSLAVLEVLLKMINLDTNLADVELLGRDIQQRIESFFNYFDLDKLLQIHKGDPKTSAMIKKILDTQTKIEPPIKEKIEKLFKEAKLDISKAKELKEQLDNLGIYKEYEDSFLDLFRPKDKGDHH
jgi:proteasome assembly chaperone (PAC2) family protein